MNLPLGYSIDTNYDATYDRSGTSFGAGDPNTNYPVTWDNRTWIWSNSYFPHNALIIPYPAEPIFPKQSKEKVVKVKPAKKKKTYFATATVCASGFDPPKNFATCEESGYVKAGGGFALGDDPYPRYPEGTLPAQYFTPIEQPVSWPMIVITAGAFYLFLTWIK